MIKNYLRTLFACVFISTATLPVHAETANNDDAVSFTLNRRDVPLSETIGSITTISGDRLNLNQNHNVLDAIKEVPAVQTTQTGGPGGTSNVFIRGANSEHTLVLLDGVPLTDPMSATGAYDFANLLADNLSRIEVSRGPQSVMYGSSALGGIVQLFTRHGAGPAKLVITGEGGELNTARGSASASGGNDKVDFLAGVSAVDTGGISQAGSRYGNTEKDPYQNQTGLVRLGLRPVAAVDLTTMVHAYNSKAALDFEGGPGGDDPNYKSTNRQLVASQKVKMNLFNGTYIPTFDFSYATHRRSYDNDFDDTHPFDSLHEIDYGHTREAGMQNDLFLGKLAALTVGGVYHDETGDFKSESEGVFGPFSSEFPTTTTRTRSLYAQDSMKLLPFWDASIGGRLDDHDLFGTHYTYRFGTGYLIEPTHTRFSGTYGTGFKSPTLFELYSPYGVTTLQPEESLGWDAGVNQSLFNEQVLIGATYFRNEFDHLINFNSSFKYENIDSAMTRGLETFATVRLPRQSIARVTYTATRTRNNETGEELLRRAKNNASFALDVPITRRWYANWSTLYVGPRKDLFFQGLSSTKVTLGAYAVTTIGATFHATRSVDLFGRVENAFNETYEEVYGFGTVGRTVYGGVKVTLGGQ